MAWRDTPELVIEDGVIKGWQCYSCTAYNDILSRTCRSCNLAVRPASINDELEASIIYDRGLVGYIMSTNDAARDLHAQFFAKERVFIRDMDNTQLREHRLTLQSIAFEARSRLTAVDAEERERDATGKRDRNWLVSSGNDPNVTDAIEVVKERKARMSKADKMAEQLSSLGLPAEQVAAMMANVAKTQDSSSKSSSTSTSLKNTQPTFNKVAGTTNNTRESLLSDISSSLIEGIRDQRPVEDLYRAAVTAGHLARALNKLKDDKSEPIKSTSDTTSEANPLFDPSKLFG